MIRSGIRTSVGLALAAVSCAGPVWPQEAACDRGCLSALADQVLDSMPAHEPSRVPLTHEYTATENSIPAALDMMVIWRTATAVKGRFYVIDAVSNQLFFLATLGEGAQDAFVYGRLRARGHRVSEVEIYENRSRGQGGFMFGAAGPANLPEEWTRPVAAAELPSRAELLRLGRAVFDSRIDGPPNSPDCVLMENGAKVAERPEVAQAVNSDSSGPKPDGKAYRPNPDGTVPIPCGTPKGRPTDPAARVEIVDEQQGIVVSQAVVSGWVEPYLARKPTESAFVPEQILKPYTDMLQQQLRTARYDSALRPMQATAAAAEVRRIYNGKLQGQLLLVNLGAAGGRSPWVGK
jgi:hypothetical protein